MKKKILYSILLLVVASIASIDISRAQCFTATYGLWPSAAFTPTCGATCVYGTITTSGYAGEYSLVNVVAGNTYTFRSSVTTDYITISNSTGTLSYSAGVGGVAGRTWTSTITGQVRFYTHTNASCGSSSVLRTRSVCCVGAAPAAPANDLAANATVISCGQTLAGTTVNATTTGTYEGVTTCGINQTMPGVWYKVTGTGQQMTASLCGTAWDSKISVYSGVTATALTCIGGIDDGGPACAGTSASYSWSSVSGTTYWIKVHGYSVNSAFSLALTCVTPFNPCTTIPTLTCGAAATSYSMAGSAG